MSLKAGDRIDRYLITGLLGRGGMGEVYRAQDERLQRSVALKVLHVPSSEAGGARPSADRATRLVREARIAAALDHPNIVAVYDVGEIHEPEALAGTPFLAMELIKGRPLRSYVGDARVPMAERLRWLADIARALAAAHAAGLVHRDIKPENVMVGEDGRIKVLDFGIARRAAGEDARTAWLDAATLTNEGIVLGTPMYMAPEQLRSEALDGRADQFAWGVVAYELLSGRVPWSVADGAISLVSQILSGAVPPLSHDSGVPERAADVVRRALAKDREARFANMGVLIRALVGEIGAGDELRSSGTGSSVGWAPEPTVPLEAGELRSKWRPAWSLALVLLALSGVTLLSAFALRVRRTRAEAASVASASCTSNRECAESHDGKPWVCRASDHACVAVDSEDCKAMYEPGDLTADDTVWLGAAFPMKESWGGMTMDSVDFARSDVARVTNALGTANALQRARRIALVDCDDSADGMRAARHMVDDVGVPAIIGFKSTAELVSVVTNLLIPRRVLAVASLSENPSITHIPQPTDLPRMVWRTNVNQGSMARAAAHFADEVLEPQAARLGHEMHVALVHGGSDTSLAFASTFYRTLAQNGNSSLKSGHGYVEVTAGEPSAAEHQRIAGLLSASIPDVIVLLIPGDERVLALVEAIEARVGAVVRPTYLLINSPTDTLKPFIAASAEHRHRVFGVDGTVNSMPNARFVIRYNQAHDASVTRDRNAGVSYDAFYLLAYSTFLLPPGETPTGPTLARGFARLMPPGKSIEFGPNDMLDGLSVLSSGGNIDVVGTQGDLDFDLATGEPGWDIAFSCAAVGSDGRPTGDDVESGALFREGHGRIEGAPRCP